MLNSTVRNRGSFPDSRGTVLLVANWPSDVGYAWWLMESFWVEIAKLCESQGYAVVLAYPQINYLPDAITSAPIEVVEFDVKLALQQPLVLRSFLRDRLIRHVYLTDWPVRSMAYPFMRMCGVKNIMMHDHTPGMRPRNQGVKVC